LMYVSPDYMNTTLSQNESREMLKWLNNNRRMLLDLYRNQYNMLLTMLID